MTDALLRWLFVAWALAVLVGIGYAALVVMP